MTTKNITKKMFGNKAAKPRPMQEWAYNKSKEGKNLLIVSSTGSGKTEASYLASRNWNRTVYALPMTTLATNLHERLNTYENRLTGEDWTLQHSVATGDAWLENKRSVTTIDQVLSGFFGFGRESLIRGKNIMRSNLILDEVQLFDPESALLSLLELLKQTTASPFNNNFSIMTATFPTSLRDYLEEHFDVEVYIEDTPSIDKKVTLDFEEKMPIKDIQMNGHRQIIVCNTQQQQIDLYNDLLGKGVDKERLIVLNSRLFPADRARAEEKVMKYFGKSSAENNKILLSTQIVEAGMDISADTLYSYEAPIDSLVQREGRTSRWGGEGRFVVVKQERMKNGLHPVYDNELVENTSAIIQRNAGQLFSWNNQLKWIDEVLDTLYKKMLSKRNQRKFRRKLKNGNSKDLIRDMEAVNIVPIEDYSQSLFEDFNRPSISVPVYLVEEGIIEDRKELVKTKRIQIGDTILVDANNWVYDECGIRGGEGMRVEGTYVKKDSKRETYEDYVEETLFEHSVETANQLSVIIQNEDILSERTETYDPWKIGAVHDIGKSTKEWQRMIRWNEDGSQASNKELYAHRPWIPRGNNGIIKRTHSLIGLLLLEEQLTEMEKNVIANHHGRIFNIESKNLIRTEWEKGTNDLLKDLGLEETTLTTDSHYFYEDDFYTPIDSEWGIFVYLTGALMEADRAAINAVREQKQKHTALNKVALFEEF